MTVQLDRLSLEDLRYILARGIPAWRKPGYLQGWMYRERMSIAVTASLMLHILLILLLLLPPPKGMPGGGGGNGLEGRGKGAEISLYTGVAPSLTKVKAPDADEAVESLDKASQTSELKASTELAQVATTLASVSLPNLAPADRSSPTSSPLAAAAGGVGQGGETAGVANDLWGAIAPCWNRLADKTTLPVELSVSFAEDGKLSKPPVIERAGSAQINDQSLRSEALALQALAACGGYAMAKGQQDVRVNFPKPQL